MSVELPPLPEPRMIGGIGDYREHWDADQMQAYARAAVDAALERAAQECEHTAATGSTEDVWDAGYDTGCNDCADVIRALKTNKEQGNE